MEEENERDDEDQQLAVSTINVLLSAYFQYIAMKENEGILKEFLVKDEYDLA